MNNIKFPVYFRPNASSNVDEISGDDGKTLLLIFDQTEGVGDFIADAINEKHDEQGRSYSGPGLCQDDVANMAAERFFDIDLAAAEVNALWDEFRDEIKYVTDVQYANELLSEFLEEKLGVNE